MGSSSSFHKCLIVTFSSHFRMKSALNSLLEKPKQGVQKKMICRGKSLSEITLFSFLWEDRPCDWGWGLQATSLFKRCYTTIVFEALFNTSLSFRFSVAHGYRTLLYSGCRREKRFSSHIWLLLRLSERESESEREREMHLQFWCGCHRAMRLMCEIGLSADSLLTSLLFICSTGS